MSGNLNLFGLVVTVQREIGSSMFKASKKASIEHKAQLVNASRKTRNIDVLALNWNLFTLGYKVCSKVCSWM